MRCPNCFHETISDDDGPLGFFKLPVKAERGEGNMLERRDVLACPKCLRVFIEKESQ